MLEICKNWFGLANSSIYYAHQTREIYQTCAASLSGFQSSGEFWIPLSKTVLSECSFIWNKVPVNIGNDGKA